MNRKQKLLLSIMKIGLMELGVKLHPDQIYNKCFDMDAMFQFGLKIEELETVSNKLWNWLQNK